MDVPLPRRRWTVLERDLQSDQQTTDESVALPKFEHRMNSLPRHRVNALERTHHDPVAALLQFVARIALCVLHCDGFIVAAISGQKADAAAPAWIDADENFTGVHRRIRPQYSTNHPI